jgi:hypothetical protein
VKRKLQLLCVMASDSLPLLIQTNLYSMTISGSETLSSSGRKKRISCNSSVADAVEGHATNPPVSNDIRLACCVIIELELNKH